MLESSRNKKQRRKIAVSLDTGDGEELVYMFVYPSERVIDTLNDDRELLAARPVGEAQRLDSGGEGDHGKIRDQQESDFLRQLAWLGSKHGRRRDL